MQRLSYIEETLVESKWARVLLALLLTIIPVFIVYQVAWVSDDAFISLRYASNIIDGHGPVFNVGEHVQGYTHPLWLAFLTLGLSVIGDPVYTATGLGLVFTVLGVAVVSYGLLSQSENKLNGLLIALLLSFVWAGSETWRSFQTSGLENSLTNFWIVLLTWLVFSRPSGSHLWLTGIIGFAWLTRPDLAPLLIPLAALVVYEAWRDRCLVQALLGFAPALAWLVFAQLYYGELLPNTADAKVGVFASWTDAAEQGLRYLEDWMQHEPLPAFLSFAALIGAGFVTKTLRERALILGVVLYLLYVVYVGGDFMRGRFLLSFLVASTSLGAFSVVQYLKGKQFAPRGYALGAFGCLLVLLFSYAIRPPIDEEISNYGIGNERAFYDGMSLKSYRENGEVLFLYYDLGWIGQLKNYSQNCGSLTMHTATVGVLGYYAGDKVTVVDTIGLNDDFIADLPRRYLIGPVRVGHPFKYIPISYLAQKDDIAIFTGWEQAIIDGDCDFERFLVPYKQSAELLHPLETIPLTPATQE